MFKNIFSKILLCSLLGVITSAQASAIITDNYIGKGYSGGDSYGGHGYDVDHMAVNFSGNLMTVTVFTYFTPHSYYNYSDLLLSTSGWKPYGSAQDGYTQDDATTTGTHWDYVFDTSEQKLYGGDFSLIKTGPQTTPAYRVNQYILRGSGGDMLENGQVIVGQEQYNGSTMNTISYVLDWTLLALGPNGELALRWTETCANDIIEGVINVPSQLRNSVPTPATTSLLVAGLLAALAIRRKTRKA